MKTIIIHPSDKTTDFLKSAYKDLCADVISDNKSKSFFRKKIKESDFVIMLGHGTENGLLGFNRYIIDSNFVQLLREVPKLMCVWCNANIFVEKYKLKPVFYTGMIISELEEAYLFGYSNAKIEEIEESNISFSSLLKSFFDKSLMSHLYYSESNEIIDFNRKNIFIEE